MSRLRALVRHRTARPIAAATTAVLGLGTVLLIDLYQGSPAARHELLGGSAWLFSREVGLLTLLDGASGEIAAQAEEVARAKADASVAQAGSTAYVADRSTGQVVKVDGATLRQTRSPAAPMTAGPGSSLHAGRGVVYTVDTARGALAETDPGTLTVRRTLSVPGSAAAPDAIADPAGGLWLLDTPSGRLRRVADGEVHGTDVVAAPGSGRLLVVGDEPVLVDVATVTRLAPRSGSDALPFRIDRADDEVLQFGGSARTDTLLVASTRRVLRVCRTIARTCGEDIPFGGHGAALGRPVEAGSHAFVPDHGAGTISVVDLGTRQLVKSPQVLPPGTPFELFERDGIAFFNDVGSNRAGVVRPDGTVLHIKKYDPEAPAPTRTTAPTNTSPALTTTTSATRTTTASTGTATTGPTTPGSSTGGTDAPLPGVRIEFSKNPTTTGTAVTLRLVSAGAQAPSDVAWTFGDGRSGSGATTAHTWNQAGRYQVSALARFPDGRTVTATASIDVADNLVPLTISKRGNGSGTITATTPGVDAGCPAIRQSCKFSFPAGQTVRLSHQAALGSLFTDWGTGPCSGTGTCDLTMPASATTISPAFALAPRKQVLTVQLVGARGGSVHSRPSGISCPSDCVQEFTEGETVQLNATTTAAARFTGWAAGGSGPSPCTEPMNPVCTFRVPGHAVSVSAGFASTATGDYGITGNDAGSSCFVNPNIDLMSITFLTSAQGRLPASPLPHLITSSRGLSTRGTTNPTVTGRAGGTHGMDAIYGATTVFTVIIDPDDAVPETDERNNGLRITFALPPKNQINGPQVVPCAAEPIATG
jgi:hypothetical protein